MFYSFGLKYYFLRSMQFTKTLIKAQGYQRLFYLLNPIFVVDYMKSLGYVENLEIRNTLVQPNLLEFV